ncbi:phosphoglycerol transferase [Chromohalobacter marismortui]|uniref:Phosphoglycerol transferase n=1 Tax=Chromohalobacter marismortui TaxID=42055 RepID=A0A4R7NNH0_9GAMM|nr:MULTISPECIES: sulfatase-like hydrolase/transferase [Chromohalobacter]MCI0509929.1 sulfatase-like hydrolase/transferase [Chromohalobacter sp.]MCI0592653.1 sulfatase-like hydrolase/transferase [Chromohalobacter sp.]TDU22172.1 phosphoglycerol transferase [Chromohalobacter marismortui]
MKMPTVSTRWLSLTYMGLCLGYTFATLAIINHWFMLPVAALWVAIAWRFRWGHPQQRSSTRRIWPWSLIPLALWWIYLYLDDSFGKLDLGAVIFHLQAGMTEHGGQRRVWAAFVFTLCGLLMLAAVTYLVRHDHRWRLWERVAAIFLLAFNPLLFGLSQRGASVVTEGHWLRDHYRSPDIVASPNTRPNLIYLYLESTERTYADRDTFGDAYEDLIALGKRGTVFEGLKQLDNTGWTTAGMVATQCGVPLIPAGLMHDNQFEPLDAVLPHTQCMGDLLNAQGYHLTYMGGASTRFAGKKVFYEGHGFDTVLGRDELEDDVTPPGYLNDWGLYDDTLLNMATERIRKLAEDDNHQPYAMFALTLAAHPPFGNPSQSCRDNQGKFDGVDILYSVKCTGWLVRRFLKRLDREGLLDNTLVVISSDHLSMKNSEWPQLVDAKRENTFMMLGKGIPAAERIQRRASMVDVYPTVLEAMGFKLDSRAAGLGRSLFAEAPTLVEKYGLETINDYMAQEDALQSYMWKGVN